MSVVEEIREQQKSALKEMDTRQKLSYFWDYYKIHTIVAIAVISLSALFIYQYVTNKDYGFYAAIINADITNIPEVNPWGSEFEEYAGIDTDHYQAYIDTSIALSDNDSTQYSMSSTEKLLAMLQTGIVDVIVSDTATFENYAQNEYFMNLKEALPEDVYAKYEDCLYYTDMATVDTGDDDTFYTQDELTDPDTYVINHRDPSTMENPVAVGICLPEDNKLIEAGCFDYLAELGTTYQGYPSEAVLGIPITSTKLDTVLKFLEFLEE
ncbi:MAG: hypothetical protein J6K48_05745 [Lachnospiraceae bacterium]|nr:hypothetical protein [Lachnospiraceae bacterium]